MSEIKWKCEACGTEFTPKGKYLCPECGHKIVRPVVTESKKIQVPDEGKGYYPEDSDVKCAFQRRIGKNKIQCGLTSRSTGSIALAQLHNDPCVMSICPMYQTWMINKRIEEKLSK
jgi:DNA-directed RNA polymerase subunit RPC12/RpoP